MGYQVYLFLDSLLGNQEKLKIGHYECDTFHDSVQSRHQGQRD